MSNFMNLKRMNNVIRGDRADSINSLLYLAIKHMPIECKVTENNDACWLFFALFIDGGYLAWFVHFKIIMINFKIHKNLEGESKR